MSHISLSPEYACFYPAAGREREIIEIIQRNAPLIQDDKNSNCPCLDVLPLSDHDLEKRIDSVYNQIQDAAAQGNVAAEKTLKKLTQLLDVPFPNYFVISEDLDYNIKMASFGDVYAMGMLGDKYYYGKRVNQDYGIAVEWYRKAASKGLSARTIQSCRSLRIRTWRPKGQGESSRMV